jgi:uncharacterized protein
VSAKTNAAGERLVACPTCRGDSVFAPSNRHRPFCSERCATIDFGAWASEAYRVPARGDSAESADDDGNTAPGA